MICLKVLLVLAASLVGTDLRVLFFTMDGCPPCQQTEPAIDQLGQSGTAVSKIDVRQYSDYAASCGVTQTPTVILTDGNRVLARHTGAMSLAQLQQLVAAHQPVAAAPASSVAPTAPQPVSTAATASAGMPAAMPAGLTPEKLAHQATVRLRVEDAEGTSFATGTVIHRVDQEALVLTCGHVFRDSNGQGKINVDLGFHAGQPVTVVGNLISFDANHHDIALIAIPCPLPIQPVTVAPETLAMQTGDRVFSLGCDRGQAPTVRQRALKAVTRYSGVAKYDTVGRPVDGRSGGGLFTIGGQLVGVCNAAAVEVDEGIYTGLQSVWWQFASSNLSHLFQPDRGGSTAGTPPVALASHSSAGPTGRIGPSGTQTNIQTAIFQGDTPPARNAVQGQITPAAASELIVLVRSSTDPSKTETITIANPDPQMLQLVEQARQAAGTPGLTSRLAGLPELEPVTRPQPSQLRAQSPR